MSPRLLIALVLTCLFAIVAIGVAAIGHSGVEGTTGADAGGFAGATMPKDLRAPDFQLPNQDGDPVSMRALRGKPVVVTFLYTHCEDTCPIQAQTVRGALDELGHDVPALAIAVDPPNDTPESAQAFLSKQHATGRIDFVLGSRDQLKRVWKGFFVRPQSVTQEHQARFTLVDSRGFQRIGYPAEQATPEMIAHDLRRLEREG